MHSPGPFSSSWPLPPNWFEQCLEMNRQREAKERAQEVAELRAQPLPSHWNQERGAVVFQKEDS